MKVVFDVVKSVEMEITDAEIALVKHLYNHEQPMKVTAIKFIKDQYKLSLHDAKCLCDTISNSSY